MLGNIPEHLKTDPDYLRGRQILKMYHDRLVKYPNYTLLSVDDLMAQYGNKGPYLAEGLGLNARVNGITNEKAKWVMDALADESDGYIPENWQAFSNSLTNFASNPSMLETIKFVGAESGKELQSAFTEVGTGVLATLKTGKYMPYLVWGGAIFLVFSSVNMLMKKAR
jgi:hypothetical protein